MARNILLTENFKELIETNSIYADKTNLVKDILNRKVVLYTRPRRFGKTLNMSMLYYFFSNQEDSFNLFKDLNIAKDAEAMKHMNQYPVISISLKELTRKNFRLQISEFINNVVYNLCDKHRYLLDSNKLEDEEKSLFDKYLKRNITEDELSSVLYNLSRMMYKHFNSEVIILIDEYDVPLRYAHQYGYYDDMLDFIRSLFSSALKTNNYLYKGIMTGCLRIAKESVFTGLNNFETDSMLNKNREAYFGFTEDEVKSILDEYDMPEKFKDIKDWYDGYLFGNIEVYNPWSTLKYIKESYSQDITEPVSYWANTSGNDIIYDYIKNDTGGLREDFESLTKGETIVKSINEQLTYRDLDNPDNIFSFLLSTGYLKATGKNSDGSYNLVIPNKEINDIYSRFFKAYFSEYSKDRTPEFVKALVEGDEAKANEALNDILFCNISYYDNSEAFYHGYILSTLRLFAPVSNVESGDGRIDIKIQDKRTKRIVGLELKHSESEDDLQKDADKAVKQLKDKRYLKPNELGYGISFCKKKCFIRKCD